MTNHAAAPKMAAGGDRDQADPGLSGQRDRLAHGPQGDHLAGPVAAVDQGGGRAGAPHPDVGAGGDQPAADPLDVDRQPHDAVG
jgi:hypothetical protein